MPKVKFYAVKVGREGPKIYESWNDCKTNTAGFPGSTHKSFASRREAEDWLKIPVPYAQAAPKTLSGTHRFHPITAGRRHLGSMPPKATPSTSSAPHEGDGFENGADFIPLEPQTPNVKLSPEQAAVLNTVKNGKSIFFTGSAGTGKSVLLREIIRTLGGSNSPSLAITASTGIAAVNIGGTTLHSWAGIGLGLEPAKNLAGKFLGQGKFRPVLDRWRVVKYLIIDEVSMLDGALFDTLETIARLVRRNEEPFGGIQLILSGDFCQLPPVPNTGKDGQQVPVAFAFEAESWDRCVGRPITLTKVFRQKDQQFANMLNAMRFGNLKPEIVEVFQSLSRPVEYDDGIMPTELFPTRSEVANANRTRLNALPGRPLLYPACDVPGTNSNGQPIHPDAMARLLERLVVPKEVILKVDAQVMLVKNLLQGELVNGSVGRVTRFASVKDTAKTNLGAILNPDDKAAKAEIQTDSERLWPMGEMEASRVQIPLIHAWALSVHKSQGQTLDRVKVDLRRTFEKGQAYVALSRATNMDHLQVLNFNASKVVAHPRVISWYQDLELKHEAFHVDEFEDEMDDEEAIAAYHSF
ncbi:ATP-dependent DNA helicase PIF1 [Pleurotus pulmonarius]